MSIEPFVKTLTTIHKTFFLLKSHIYRNRIYEKDFTHSNRINVPGGMWYIVYVNEPVQNQTQIKNLI